MLKRLTALFALAATAAQADSVTIASEGGYARLLFTLAPAAHATTTASEGVLTVAFDRKIAIDPAQLSGAQTYIGSARLDADGRTLRLALAQRLRAHTSASGEKIAVDLIPAGFAGTPPDLPAPSAKVAAPIDPNSLAALKVRSGSYRNFTRLVFDWPKNVAYSVFPGAGKLTIRFASLARPDFSALLRQSPPWVKNAAWHIEGQAIVVEFETDQASGFHDFRDGTRVVLDVLAPKTDADAYTPPGTAKVKPTPLSQSAQAQAVATVVAKLSNAPQPTPTPAPAPAPAPTPAASPATPPPPVAAPPTAANASAEGRLTRDGASMVFAGAGRKGAAAFMRGLTAWIVLDDAAPLDAVKLKSQLGTFPEAVEAASGNGVSVLRITFKSQEQIAAFAEGADLKIVIAPQVTPNATAIGFARNQDDAAHSSITTLLQGASRFVKLSDPVAGDDLVIVPAAAGHAMFTTRSYVEFQALETASGLVLLPLVDDLSVSVDTARVTVTRKGGLSLTAPAMATAESPAALASAGTGPSYLDFARWSRIQDGSLLATERQLNAGIARAKPEGANQARLKLARFYLANNFAAETLGLIKLIQSCDPALQSDRQLLVMRAAANFEMGRYREAHNDLAGAAFDGDRHAAFWRGLIEAALEDWSNAQGDLDRAGPVLRLYPSEWQARARLASADAALGLGHLELADAALARLPSDLPQDMAIEAQLERARLYAAENRAHDAASLFAAVENSGNERAAARAIFFRVNAGVSAGTLSSNDAITALEKLRFRWRGDALEMKTLRKLSALYFAKARWRDGLHTLRLAAESFPGDDARQAQDDMRAGFVDLFLRGKADKIPPVEALALFYDNLDQTPIGPDGDEMIRRMADRLVAVDLLGPAADLLKYQIDKRLDGVAQAQVATRLAEIYLMDKKPELALNEIRLTQISMLPDDVGHRRMLVEARALADLKRYDDALDRVAVDKAGDTARLRADIYWQAGQWAMAGKMAEDLLASHANDAAPLGENDRRMAMRAAVAYSLANDETSLERLRTQFAAKMKTTPDAAAFDVLSARIDAHGAAFRDAAAQVASIDTLQSFMKDLRTRTN
jgi:hypothetical protein